MRRLSLTALSLLLIGGSAAALAAPDGQARIVQASAGQACSADALPAAERSRMQAEYKRRVIADGKASADAWVREQGRAFRQRLVDQGVCPASTQEKRATQEKKVVRGKDGTPCKRTRLENRNVANLGGGAMSMILVPVCAD